MKGDTVAHLVGRVNRLLWRPWLDCSRMFNGGGVGGLRPRHSGRPRTSRPRTSSCRACSHHNTQRSKGNAHGHTGRVWAAASLRTACAEREATNNRAKGGDLTAQHASSVDDTPSRRICPWRRSIWATFCTFQTGVNFNAPDVSPLPAARNKFETCVLTCSMQ